MRHYELMVILDPDSRSAPSLPSLDQFLTVVRNDGGSVEKVDIWGRRRLVVRDRRRSPRASTPSSTSQAEPATVKELDRQLNLNEAVLRTKVLRPDQR